MASRKGQVITPKNQVIVSKQQQWILNIPGPMEAWYMGEEWDRSMGNKAEPLSSSGKTRIKKINGCWRIWKSWSMRETLKMKKQGEDHIHEANVKGCWNYSNGRGLVRFLMVLDHKYDFSGGLWLVACRKGDRLQVTNLTAAFLILSSWKWLRCVRFFIMLVFFLL